MGHKNTMEIYLDPWVVPNNRGDEWSIKIFNCSQKFTFARFARKS